MAHGYILVTMQLVFHDRSPHWRRSLFLVPEFCFSPPFCLLNFALSYSTWIIISLLLVFYPHSVHSISSSFVFSFVLTPHNSLAFFFFSHPTNHQPGCCPCSPAQENCQVWNPFLLYLSVSSSIFCCILLVAPQAFIRICWLCIPGVFCTVSSFLL